MVMNPANSPGAVIVDANVLIGICANEQDKVARATAAMRDYAAKGWSIYAPGVIVAECLFALCGKVQNGLLTPVEHEQAINSLITYLSGFLPPPGGDAALTMRAEEIRSGYGCSRSADGLYIALAEELTQVGPAELLTFDTGLPNQAARNAPTVKVNVLPC